MSDLTHKQQLFIKEYLVDLNATKAAIRAGYSKKTARKIGSENLTKPDIQIELRKHISKRSDKLQTSSEEVLKELLITFESCKLPTPVLDRKGKPTGRFQFDNASAIRCLELIGRHLGMFKRQQGPPRPSGRVVIV